MAITYISAKAFYEKYLGKVVDVDGYYGAQCWDLFAKFCQDEHTPVFNCQSTGYVRDIWTNRNKSGILKYFDAITPSKIEYGDWVVFPSTYNATPKSHIGMCVGKNKIFGQNQGKSVANVITLDISKAYGGLRFKNYPKTTTSTTTKTTTAKKSVAVIAQEVIDGKWGNGTARKTALEKAGYNYNTVQTKVNELLAKKTTTTKSTAIKVGDTVTVTNPINYNTGKTFKLWYKQYQVLQLSGTRAVIGVHGIVTSAINVKYLKKV